MKLTEEELKELILTLMVGGYIREAVEEYQGKEYDPKNIYQRQLAYFLELAEQLSCTDLVELFEGELIPSNQVGLLEDKIIAEYDDMTFWEALELRMGKRDFFDLVSII